jgi:hypothetical protein
VERLEKLVAKAGPLFSQTGRHSKLATVYFKICGERPHIAFLEVIEGR